MGYVLGIDLGTSYAAAAIDEDGKTEIVQIGSRAAVIPSVVVLRADGEVLVGEAAERRSYSEPARTAREFKRRLGDPTPIILGGTPYGAESVMALLFKAIVSRVVEQRGAPPALIAITHPASYGPYKLDLLAQATRQADIGETIFLSEPEAAAIHYSEQERVEAGTVVAIYDFGGGTFDASVLRKTADGFEPLGRPEGLERLGGIDFDEAIFQHVLAAIRDQAQGLDPNSAEAQTAFVRMREECREAKEALSADTEAVIAVALPNLHTDIRITRSEFESIVSPRVRETVSALERSVRSASLTMTDISRILLVGGTSRIPMVGALVREFSGRPVATDAHPKHAVALGAAVVARRRLADMNAASAPGDEEAKAGIAAAGESVILATPLLAVDGTPSPAAVEVPNVAVTPPVSVEPSPVAADPSEIVMTPLPVDIEPSPGAAEPPEIVMTPPPVYVEPAADVAGPPEIFQPPPPVTVFAAAPPEDRPAAPVIPVPDQILFTAPPTYTEQAAQAGRAEPPVAPEVPVATAASATPQAIAIATPIASHGASSPPPPASPPAKPNSMDKTPAGGNRRMLVIGLAAAAVAIGVGAGLALMLGGSDDPDAAAELGETATATTSASESPEAEETSVVTVEPTSTLPPVTSTPASPSATNTVPAPSATPTLAPNTSRISAIEVADGRYSVDFDVAGFAPQVASQHVHFFFDTVAPVQAGVPGAGPWFLYGGPSPFTGYAVTDRPPGATELCILVARPDHSVIQATGNCVQLP